MWNILVRGLVIDYICLVSGGWGVIDYVYLGGGAGGSLIIYVWVGGGIFRRSEDLGIWNILGVTGSLRILGALGVMDC